jgi:hypothetical protein
MDIHTRGTAGNHCGCEGYSNSENFRHQKSFWQETEEECPDSSNGIPLFHYQQRVQDESGIQRRKTGLSAARSEAIPATILRATR